LREKGSFAILELSVSDSDQDPIGSGSRGPKRDKRRKKRSQKTDN
jgi:hypothetical protein